MHRCQRVGVGLGHRGTQVWPPQPPIQIHEVWEPKPRPGLMHMRQQGGAGLADRAALVWSTQARIFMGFGDENREVG